MHKNKKFLAIIPARGGSKRLPGKNILALCGKPLISWSIEASLQSNYIDKTIITSDDNKILKIAQKYHVDLIKRPDILAQDHSSTFDSIVHALKNITEKFDYIVLLQPTSPLRKSFQIDEAIELLLNKKADEIISVCLVEHPIQWSSTLSDNIKMDDFIKQINTKRSQDLDDHYRLNGAIYIISIQKMLEEKSLFLPCNCYAYKMDRMSSIDIDEKIDLIMAEAIIKKGNI